MVRSFSRSFPAILILSTGAWLLPSFPLPWTRSPRGPTLVAADELLVFAAASTTEAVTEVAALYEAAAGAAVRISFASSSALAHQIAQGARADVFISANPRWMDFLETRDLLVPDTRFELLANRLVLIAPRGRGFAASLEKGFDFASSFTGRLALADPDHVPAGTYAREALDALGFWDEISPRVVPALDVRAALVLVERGECAAGIVYATDARASSAVETIAVFPSRTHSAILYPVAAVRVGNEGAARRFLDFLRPSPAATVFRRFGFDLPRPAPAAERRDRETKTQPETRSFLSADELEALRLSLRVGLLATFGSLPFGIALGWLLARRRFPGKLLLEAVLTLPLVVPPVVTGYLLLLALGTNGLLGPTLEAIGVPVAFNWKGAAVAAAVVGFPLMVRAVRLSVEAVDPGLEAAARTLGAGPWRVFATVTLPLSLPGVFAGMVLCFARGLGEFGATITFVGNIQGDTRTLPLAIFTHTQVPGAEESALRLTVISLIVALAALLVSEYLARRSRRRLQE